MNRLEETKKYYDEMFNTKIYTPQCTSYASQYFDEICEYIILSHSDGYGDQPVHIIRNKEFLMDLCLTRIPVWNHLPVGKKQRIRKVTDNLLADMLDNKGTVDVHKHFDVKWNYNG